MTVAKKTYIFLETLHIQLVITILQVVAEKLARGFIQFPSGYLLRNWLISSGSTNRMPSN